MTTSQLPTTPYGRRVELVKDVIEGQSALDADAARQLAVHILHALDSIPEKMR